MILVILMSMRFYLFVCLSPSVLYRYRVQATRGRPNGVSLTRRGTMIHLILSQVLNDLALKSCK